RRKERREHSCQPHPQSGEGEGFCPMALRALGKKERAAGSCVTRRDKPGGSLTLLLSDDPYFVPSALGAALARRTRWSASPTVRARNSRLRITRTTTSRRVGALITQGAPAGVSGSIRSNTNRKGNRMVLSKQTRRKPLVNSLRPPKSRRSEATRGASQS